jgi:hypothetical protein
MVESRESRGGEPWTKHHINLERRRNKRIMLFEMSHSLAYLISLVTVCRTISKLVSDGVASTTCCVLIDLTPRVVVGGVFWIGRAD